MMADDVVCILRYLVKGIETVREEQTRLQHELQEILPRAQAITILAVVEGYTIDIEMQDIAPFTRHSFEPYVAEQVLPEAVAICCRTRGTVSLQLLKAHYA